jgi:hypothetical protein
MGIIKSIEWSLQIDSTCLRKREDEFNGEAVLNEALQYFENEDNAKGVSSRMNTLRPDLPKDLTTARVFGCLPKVTRTFIVISPGHPDICDSFSTNRRD